MVKISYRCALSGFCLVSLSPCSITLSSYKCSNIVYTVVFHGAFYRTVTDKLILLTPFLLHLPRSLYTSRILAPPLLTCSPYRMGPNQRPRQTPNLSQVMEEATSPSRSQPPRSGPGASRQSTIGSKHQSRILNVSSRASFTSISLDLACEGVSVESSGGCNCRERPLDCSQHTWYPLNPAA